MDIQNFFKELSGSRPEGELLKTIFYSISSSLMIFLVVYYLTLRFVSDFIPKYGFFLFFSVLSYSLIMPAIRQVRLYKNLNCMSGMMVGMTIGMISGFLPGFFIGATNGMFWGSVSGMFVGIFMGVLNGKCCGIMGILEGIMAGFMGGLMGAMTSVMMINDNVKAAGVIVFSISAVIMFLLNYMIYKEMKENEIQSFESQVLIIGLSIILTLSTIWLMVLGPRSVLF